MVNPSTVASRVNANNAPAFLRCGALARPEHPSV